MTLVLASASPRRATLLGLMVERFRVVPADVDETLPQGPPIPALEELAFRKADASEGRLVLAADTAILLGDDVLGKPDSPEEAAAMLARLVENPHKVVTAVAMRIDDRVKQAHVVTDVRLDLDAAAQAAYIASGAWEGKAGAYGIQDEAIAPHAHIDGPWSNVVGLPLAVTRSMLASANIRTEAPPSEEELRAQNPF